MLTHIGENMEKFFLFHATSSSCFVLLPALSIAYLFLQDRTFVWLDLVLVYVTDKNNI